MTCICLPWFTVLVSGSHWWGIFSWCDLYLFFINHGYSFWIPLMGYDFFVGWMCLFFIHDSIFCWPLMVHFFSHHLVSLFPPSDVICLMCHFSVFGSSLFSVIGHYHLSLSSSFRALALGIARFAARKDCSLDMWVPFRCWQYDDADWWWLCWQYHDDMDKWNFLISWNDS